MGTLLHICTKFSETIELSFLVLSVVGHLCIRWVLTCSKGKGRFPGVLAPLVSVCFNDVFLHRNAFD